MFYDIKVISKEFFAQVKLKVFSIRIHFQEFLPLIVELSG